ncbi:unnamed protein product [Polarella glacialis]|uniref:PDZ domain-containing protein n=1 Tax=Polarella glacialis TaxID=89957 RepID=A0A813DZI0_POLGL|nr:unnamed protein product [Polarella glacialis]
MDDNTTYQVPWVNPGLSRASSPSLDRGTSVPLGRATMGNQQEMNTQRPDWSKGTAGSAGSAPASGAVNSNKRILQLQYMLGESPADDILQLGGGQGEPVVVQKLAPGGKAEKAGVKVGAVLRSMNGQSHIKHFPGWQLQSMLVAPVKLELEQDPPMTPSSPRRLELLSVFFVFCFSSIFCWFC